MANESNNPVRLEYFLEPGHIFIATESTLISTTLGSCVSVCLHDKKRKTGGMNHFQLPYTREKHESTARYGNVATISLIQMMIRNGSKVKHLEAQIFGGAHNAKVSNNDVGRENVAVARKILVEKRISLVSEDVGGKKGRKVVFNNHTNETAVLKVNELPKGDWYPYERR